MKKYIQVIIGLFICNVLFLFFLGLKDNIYTTYHRDNEPKLKLEPYKKDLLSWPNDLEWQNGSQEKTFASPKAVKGGVWQNYLMEFPPTFRQVGPEGNSSFRGELDAQDMALVDMHPETKKYLPALAKRWAISKDKKTVYYELDEDATWDDGTKVTTDDFIFCLKFMISRNLLAPWYNQYYSTQILGIRKFDDYKMAVDLPTVLEDPVYSSNLSPLPRHYYIFKEGVIRNYQFAIAKNLLKANRIKLNSDDLLYNELLQQEQQLNKRISFLEKLITNNIILELDNKEKFIKKEKLFEELIKIKETNSTKSKDEIKSLLEEYLNKQITIITQEIQSIQTKNVSMLSGDVEDNWISKYNWKIPPRTGPYNIKQFTKGKEIIFARNKNWWAKDKKFYKNRYNVDFIKYMVLNNEQLILHNFAEGKIDQLGLTMPKMWHVKAKYLKPFERGYAQKIIFFNETPRPSYQISLNCKDSQLKNRDVRLAVIYSLDIQGLIDNVLNGDYKRAETFHEGYGKFTHPTLKARRFSIQKSIEHAKKAGYSTLNEDGIRVNNAGDKLSFKILFPFQAHNARLVYLQTQAKKAGIELILRTGADAGEIYADISAKKHQIAWHGWGERSKPSYYGTFHKDNAVDKETNNFSNLADDKISSLIEQYRKAENETEKIRLAHTIEEALYEKANAIPIYKVPYFRVGLWRYVKYPSWCALNSSEAIMDYYGLFWIDQQAKKDLLDKSRNNTIIYNIDEIVKRSSKDENSWENLNK